MIDFGELIRRERLTRGLDYAELGRLAGVSNMSVHRVEHGGNVTITTLEKILNVFDKELGVVER